MEKTIRYSIVIPILNEEKSIHPLYTQIKRAFVSIEGTYEIIFINDGSTDKSLEIISSLSKNNTDVHLIDFPIHSGKTKALHQGFQKCQGEFVILIDGDLQSDPNDIPKLLAKLNEGYDGVCGWRKKRKDNLVKKALSNIASLFQQLFLKTKIHDLSCTLGVFKRSCIAEIPLKKEGFHRFIPYLIQEKGYSITELPINHRPRIYGKTKYNLFTKALRTIGDFLYLIVKKGD